MRYRRRTEIVEATRWAGQGHPRLVEADGGRRRLRAERPGAIPILLPIAVGDWIVAPGERGFDLAVVPDDDFRARYVVDGEAARAEADERFRSGVAKLRGLIATADGDGPAPRVVVDAAEAAAILRVVDDHMALLAVAVEIEIEIEDEGDDVEEG